MARVRKLFPANSPYTWYERWSTAGICLIDVPGSLRGAAIAACTRGQTRLDLCQPSQVEGIRSPLDTYELLLAQPWQDNAWTLTSIGSARRSASWSIPYASNDKAPRSTMHACICHSADRRSVGHRHLRNVFRVPRVSCGQGTVQSLLIDEISMSGLVCEILVAARGRWYGNERARARIKLRVSVSNASLKIIILLCYRGTWKNAAREYGTGFSERSMILGAHLCLSRRVCI